MTMPCVKFCEQLRINSAFLVHFSWLCMSHRQGWNRRYFLNKHLWNAHGLCNPEAGAGVRSGAEQTRVILAKTGLKGACSVRVSVMDSILGDGTGKEERHVVYCRATDH